MKTKDVSKVFHFKYVYFGQPVSEYSVFRTTYIPKCTTMASYNAPHQVVVNAQKMSDNSNNIHFAGIRFICSPYLAIRSAHASFGLIMASYRPQMNLTPSK